MKDIVRGMSMTEYWVVIAQKYLQNDKNGFYADEDFWREVKYIAKRRFRK